MYSKRFTNHNAIGHNGEFKLDRTRKICYNQKKLNIDMSECNRRCRYKH